MKKRVLAGIISMALIIMVTSCISIPASTIAEAEVKQQEQMIKGFQGEMKNDLLDSTKALVDFYPSSGFAKHYWGLVFIRQIDDRSVNYEGYASSALTGTYDNFFYLTPGEHTISKVRWQNQAVVGGSGSQWADNLAITYNFEAGKYYKLWAESFLYDTGEKTFMGTPKFETKVRLVISQLN